MQPESTNDGDGVDGSAVLAGAAGVLGLPLDPTMADRLAQYWQLLQRWNRTYNLTAVRDPAEMLTQHLADCLAAIGPLRREIAGIEHVRLLDVGSGGGLPGAVIAIVCPDIHVTCVDSVGKKAAFVRQVAVELKLPNLAVQHARVEALELPAFDVVASRAFASLRDFTQWTAPLLKRDGRWMAMKGRRPDDEITALGSDVTVFHVEPLRVPGLEAERCIVWMRPNRSL